ncbi:imm11 family protein [Defluviitalea phaphyphila]|uniref:imm11 family protein n=1 Tax=Defluviitalea phaphyphila TaxID=1473580 RepID=UPI0038BC9A4F
MIDIEKHALKREKIKDKHIFRLKDETFPIFVSEKVVKALKKNRITGCDFLEVKVV